MSQFAKSGSQAGDWEELDDFLCRLEVERLQENSWHEPYELRGSRTVLWGTGGEIPPVYPALHFWGPESDHKIWDLVQQISLKYCSVFKMPRLIYILSISPR